MPALFTRFRAANLGIIAVILAVIVTAIWIDRQRVVQEGYRDVNNIADTLSLHMRNDFAAIDAALLHISRTLNTDHLEDPALFRSSYEALAATAQGLPHIQALFIITPNGRTLLTSRTPASEAVDLSDRQIFTALRDDRNVGLYIEPPVRGRAAPVRGQLIINAGRRLERSDGSFAGVVTAAIPVERLQDMLATLDLGDDGVVALFRSDGTYVLRQPYRDISIGQSVAGGRFFQERLSKAPSGSYESYFPSDNLVRLSAYRTLQELPLVLLVGVSKNEVLSDWRLRATFGAALAMALAGMVLAFTEFLQRSVRREREQDRERVATLRAIADTSIELLTIDDIETLVTRATERTRALIPSHQCMTSLTASRDLSHPVRVASCSDKYTQSQIAADTATGRGLQRVVCERNHALRLTQSELARHPWQEFGVGTPQNTQVKGWLGAPLVSQSGQNLGLIYLSDRIGREFNAEDEAILVQLANLVSVCVENAQLLRRSREDASRALAAQMETESVLSSISDALYVLDNDFRFTYLNDRAVELIRRSREELLGKCVWDEFPEAKDTVVYEAYHRSKATGDSTSVELFYEPLNTWFGVRVFPHDSGLSIYFRDITEQVQTEEKLQQAQKLKAVGQLTGGVAHDFNNLLTVILGNADILTEELRNNPNLLSLAEMTRSAAERAAELTKRLLAFARRQPLNPKTVDINKLVSGFETLLRRTLGEQISIELVQGAGLWKASIDASQLESALLNLAINARDAMPRGGRLTIETTNAYIDDAYADEHEEVVAGQYVLVAVSDTGEGIPKDLLPRVFEPFFTTKDVGKGSGLGLSMIYGFIKQSGGHVKIYSEVGEGTTVKLYLPRTKDDAQVAHEHAAQVASQGGKETILLVEDDEMVRSHVKTQLIDLGYTVVEAGDAHEATDLFAQGQRIDLLFTDIVMPGGVNGRKLADQLRTEAPELKVLFMSGYTENAIVHHGRLDAGVFLLNKPFRKQDLARKIRQVFDAET